ncbi:MAG: hypothetical protein SH848_09510 [Saprospiraceae bacterium]|nr:hypothetical protein [Saprospiraceae bacterium]MDZ4704155.1 hypothetical protein [Saprospiraceae bacterium]
MKSICFILLIGWGCVLSAQNGWFDNNPQWVNAVNSFWRGTGVEYLSVQGDTVIQGYPAKVFAMPASSRKSAW